MAIPFRRKVDLTLKELLNLKLQHVAGNHPTAESGVFHYNSSANRVQVHNGTAFKQIAFTDDVLGGDPDNLAPLAEDAHAESAALGDYQSGFSVMRVTSGANWGPNSSQAGAVATLRVGSDGVQRFTQFADGKSYERIYTGAAWGSWGETAKVSDITSAISNHEGASDPHTQYQRESEKGQANGYASLDGSSLVPDAQIPGGIARDSEVTSAISAHASASDPHTEYQKESEKGQNNGYASLDGSGKVPTSELPDTVVGGVEYKGTWNANTNSPSLGDSGAGGTKGDYYRVATAGTTSVDGIAEWAVGDWIIHNGTVWQKVDNTDSVTSVDGRTGVVTLGDLYTKKVSLNVGDGTSSHTVTHNMNTRDLDVTLRLAGSPYTVVTAGFEIDFPGLNTVRVQSDDNIATDELRITLVG